MVSLYRSLCLQYFDDRTVGYFTRVSFCHSCIIAAYVRKELSHYQGIFFCTSSLLFCAPYSQLESPPNTCCWLLQWYILFHNCFDRCKKWKKKLSCSKNKQLCHVSVRLTFSSCFDSFHSCTQLLICMQKKGLKAFKIHRWKKTFFAHKSIASTILQLINKPIEDLVMLLLPLCSVYMSLPRNSLTQLVKLLV